MKEMKSIKRCLALFLALAMVISGMTIPEKKATAAEDTSVTSETTEANDTSVEYVAQIGEQSYATFADALGVANVSTEDVTIKLLADIELTSSIEINNTNGKNIIIDGTNGDGRYTLTISSVAINGQGNPSIQLHQTDGNITFQNINIEHGGTEMLLRLGENTYGEGTDRALTVNMTNMDITSTSTYAFCLMATQALGRFDINMTDVNVYWNGNASFQQQRAFLRCGNGTNEQKVYFTATGCTIDVSDTPNTQGMYICGNVDGAFNLNNTHITIPAAAPAIYTKSSSATATITSDADCAFTRVHKVATADEFTTALTNANASTEDVTIKLAADIELTSFITINNTSGKNITIDGTNGNERYTLSMTTSVQSILVSQTSGKITFQNMNIIHGGFSLLLRLGNNTYDEGTERTLEVVMENVDITSTSSYTYCLMATQALGQFDINMTNVNVDWNGAYGHNQRAFLRCGDGSHTQTVNLTATGCTIDVSDTTQTQGMYICASVSGAFKLNNTDIIIPAAATAIYTKSSSATATIAPDADCTFTRVYKVATADEFTTAVDNANGCAEDVTIKLEADIELTSFITINNTSGKNITIDGTNGNERYTLSMTTSVQSILVSQTSGKITFQNMNIIHGGSSLLLRLGNNTYDEGTERTLGVVLENVDITSTSSYTYCLMATQALGQFDINMINVNVDWNGAYGHNQRAFLRCGDGSHNQTVNFTATGCTIDVSDTTQTQGMYICASVSGAFKLKDTDVITPSAATAMYTNLSSATATITLDADCNFIYKVATADEFTTALKVGEKANASTEDVIIKLAADIELTDFVTINNINGKNITIDGTNGNERYTLSMTTSVQSILVSQTSGKITFQNMNIIHGGSSLLLRLGNNTYDEGTERTLGVVLENMDITSTSTYSYCLMATQALGQFDINMTNVNVDWNGDASNAQRAFLRCGDGSHTQTVNLTATGCTIDVSDATQTQGMYILAKVSGKFELNDTDIITSGANTYTNSGNVEFDVKDDCEFSTNGGILIAEIGGQTYLTFERALTVANASSEDVTIKLLADIELNESITIDNAKGKNITIDGAKDDARHTLTISSTGAGNHSIKIHQTSGNITFQNMNIVHGGDQMLLRLGEGKYSHAPEKALKFNMENVDITSTSSYTYCLMATQDLGQFDINMTNVVVDWNGAYGHDQRAFLRCGNGSDAQTVNLIATGCTIDVSDTTQTQGMYICAGVSGTFEFNDTDIITPDGATTYTNNGSATVTYVYEVNTDDEFKTAVENAKTFTENVKIKLLADIELTDVIEINNANGKNITFDGANGNERYTLTMTTSVQSILVSQKSGNIAFQNMNIVHNGTHMLLRLGNDKYTETTKKTLKVNLENMNITSTSTYPYCLMGTQDLGQFDINMTNANVDWNGDDTTQSSRAFLRCGKGVDYAQTVNLTATGCTIDVSDTTQTQGMYICAGVSGTFEFNDTEIITPVAAKPYTNSGNVQFDVDDECNGIPDGCKSTYEKYDNVTAFRTADGFKAPNTVPTGYVFAGWYTDQSCAAQYALEENDTTTSTAFAKFVPEHVIEVKAQISANLINNNAEDNGSGAIRFVTTVDSLDYEEVGFKYTITNAGKELLSDTKKSDVVYKKLYAVGTKDGEPLNYTPEFAFCAESEYFKAVTFKNISSALFDAEITVQPFWITLDGTTVYGEAVTKTVNQGIKGANSEGNVVSGSESTESVYTNRLVLLSDTHYMTDNPVEGVDAPSAGMTLGYTQAQKISLIKEDMTKFAEEKTVNGVLVLGDLGTDDYGYRTLSDNANYVQKFKEEVMAEFPGVSYAIPGNHDSYPNDIWNTIFGYDRQYSVKIGDVAFIMLDTYADLSAVDGSGSGYTGIDVDWLKTELEKYPTEKIFLCCHFYAEGKNTNNDAKLKELIAGNDRIVCMFRGHTHINGAYTPDSLAGIPLIDIGGYAYNVYTETQEDSDGNPITITDYNKFDESWAWGYQVLEWNEEEVHLYHVKPARTYTGSNGTFNFAGAIEDDIVIKLK